VSANAALLELLRRELPELLRWAVRTELQPLLDRLAPVRQVP
jgi:hypothetical protein